MESKHNDGVDGIPDDGMIASAIGMRARDPWEMDRPQTRLLFWPGPCPDCGAQPGQYHGAKCPGPHKPV